MTFFTGYFFLQVTWSVSSPSVAGRDEVPTGFAEVAQPVQISQIQQGVIEIHCNLSDVTINDQMQKKYHGYHIILGLIGRQPESTVPIRMTSNTCPRK